MMVLLVIAGYLDNPVIPVDALSIWYVAHLVVPPSFSSFLVSIEKTRFLVLITDELLHIVMIFTRFLILIMDEKWLH